MSGLVNKITFMILPLFLCACQTVGGENNGSTGFKEKLIKPVKPQPIDTPVKETVPAVDISHKYKYKVRGKQYKVFSSSKNFQEIGNASWYGPGFHGKLTANGEVYNMHAMTAAHKTLPLGTKVQVTHLKNGRKIIVRINDRGPFHGGRIIDLSKAAAKKLGLLNSGYAKVHVKITK